MAQWPQRCAGLQIETEGEAAWSEQLQQQLQCGPVGKCFQADDDLFDAQVHIRPGLFDLLDAGIEQQRETMGVQPPQVVKMCASSQNRVEIGDVQAGQAKLVSDCNRSLQRIGGGCPEAVVGLVPVPLPSHSPNDNAMLQVEYRDDVEGTHQAVLRPG